MRVRIRPEYLCAYPWAKPEVWYEADREVGVPAVLYLIVPGQDDMPAVPVQHVERR